MRDGRNRYESTGMGAACIDERVRAWACDAVDSLAFGTEYRVAVTWGPVPVPDPAGGQGGIAPGWYLAITTRNPIVGEPRLCHIAPIGVPEPDEKTVRQAVNDGIRQLRDLAASKLATGQGANGGPAAAR